MKLKLLLLRPLLTKNQLTRNNLYDRDSRVAKAHSRNLSENHETKLTSNLFPESQSNLCVWKHVACWFDRGRYSRERLLEVSPVLYRYGKDRRYSRLR